VDQRLAKGAALNGHPGSRISGQIRLTTPAALQTQSADGVTYVSVDVVWLDLSAGPGRIAEQPGLPPRWRETASAVARDLPALDRGARLAVGGETPWRVVSVRRREPARGFVTAELERFA
jgi:hypothetical protein